MANFCLLVFGGHSLRGRKIQKQNPPGKPRTNPANILFDCVYVCEFFYTEEMDTAVLGDRLPEVSQRSLSSAQAASLCSAGIVRALTCPQGDHFVRCCHSTQSLLFRDFRGGPQRRSAAVCNPNPPRPFARYRVFFSVPISQDRHKASYRVNRRLTTIYDMFCPAPVLLSPFGFHQV